MKLHSEGNLSPVTPDFGPLGHTAICATTLTAIRRFHVGVWALFSNKPKSEQQNRFSATILKVDRIGDFILALSAIRLTTQRFGEKNCAIVVSPLVEELAHREFPSATIFVVPAFLRHKQAWPGWWRARRELSTADCDHLVCLRHQRWDYDELMLTWIRANHVHVLEDPRASGWVLGRRSMRIEATAVREIQISAGICRELELHRQVLAELFNGEILPQTLLPKFTSFLGSSCSPYIAIAPFSSAPIKDIPLSILKAVSARFQNEQNQRILLVGSPEQRVRLNALSRNMKSWCACDMEVATPARLTDFVEIISNASWILTADSAAAHIATAFDRPTVVLLGGGHFGQFGPWYRSGRQRWVSHALPCFNCGWSCHYEEPFCLTRVSAGEVTIAINEVINTNAASVNSSFNAKLQSKI